MTDLPGEIWRRVPLPSVAAVVFASDHGRVLSQTIRGGDVVLKPRLRHKYWCVALRHIGSRQARSYPVHRLVCLAFKGPPPTPDHQAAHEDGNPQRNTPDNLNWKTAVENSHDRYRHGTMYRRLSPEAVRDILESSEPHIVVARRLGVHERTIASLRHGRSYHDEFAKLGGWRGRHDWERDVRVNTQWGRRSAAIMQACDPPVAEGSHHGE